VTRVLTNPSGRTASPPERSCRGFGPVTPGWSIPAALLAALAACASAPKPLEVGFHCELLRGGIPVVVEESSGLAVSRRDPHVVWTHDDSGGGTELFALTLDGRPLGRVRIPGSSNVDWEDVEIGPCEAGDCLYIGDIGDNEARRDEVVVYRIPEPLPDARESVPAERFRMTYPQGPRDAESLFVLPSGEVFVVTRGRGSPVELYRYPPPLRSDRTVRLEFVRALSVGRVPLPDQVTGATASPDGRHVALRSHTTMLLYETGDLISGADPVPMRMDLTPLAEVQGEAIALGPGGLVVLSSEAGLGAPAQLDVLSCALP
jgi:hypothetical protein